MVPSTALFDVPVAATVSGLSPGAETTVTAQAVDAYGVQWSAHAQFTANRAGVVTLADPSSGGSYRGVDPMGLFDLMTPARPTTASSFIFSTHGATVTLRAVVAGAAVAATTVVRHTPDTAGLVEHDERPATTGIYGDLYLPARTTVRRPAVLVIGGSEGGLSTAFLARSLTAHGYPTLALAYFDEPGLPSTLRAIPLEYFARAATLLARQPSVDPAHVLVWGTSHGSEAALPLGADYPHLVHGVIAGSPSNHVSGGYPDSDQPAWTQHGVAVPDAPDSVIPVEQINGPVVTICGGQDNLWSSCRFAQAITTRRTAHHVPFTDVALSYPAAGHSVGGAAGYFPITTSTVTTATREATDFGGTIAADAAANGEAHTQVLHFLAMQ